MPTIAFIGVFGLGASVTGTDQLQYLCRSDIFMNMNAASIDVPKQKSTVTILRPGGKTVRKPFDVLIVRRFPISHKADQGA